MYLCTANTFDMQRIFALQSLLTKEDFNKKQHKYDENFLLTHRKRHWGRWADGRKKKKVINCVKAMTKKDTIIINELSRSNFTSIRI